MVQTPQIIARSIRDMMIYFSKRPQETVIDMYVDALRAFTQEQALMAIKSFITSGGQMPKIVDLIVYIRNTFEVSEYKRYDEEDDFDYPIHFLWLGFDLLEKNEGNMNEFHEFCEKNHMPRKDRDRVLGKYVMANKINRKELLGGWHHLYKG